MGQLKDKKIDIIRSWDDPNKEPVPEYDYTAIYPVTTYEAVHKTMDDESTSLESDLNDIRAAIEGKQDILNAGTPGNLMVWGAEAGDIGEMEVVKTINPDDTARSYQKVTSERAVGKAIDLKANTGDLNAHKADMVSHITEEERAMWNSMASGEAVQEHIQNLDIHVTLEDKERWDEKADAQLVIDHMDSTTNPHRVTAHQTGTYSSSELDTMFSSIKESFFNFENIHYDESTGTATLGENTEEGYNPDYVLGYGSDLPTPVDDTLTYFAIRPVTDYSTNLSNEAIIYLKEPTRTWREVGVVEVADGDMVIRKADSAMCVWLEGRFMILDAITAGGSGGSSDLLWRPIVSAEGILSFVRSTEITPPDPVDIKGPAGYTPQKGIDYFDGADGIGIPEGGEDGQVIVKTSEFDYDTKWMSFADWLDQYVDPGDLPHLLADWDNIQNKPEIYQELGDDDFGLISQKATTAKFTSVDDAIEQINIILGGAGGVTGLIDKLNQHLLDYANPHRISASQIGAVSNDTFLTHSMNRNNPHNVTADQIGLGNVSNTSDADKPISIATQEALDAINNTIQEIIDIIGGDKMITSVEWDEPHMTLIFGYADGETLEVRIPITDIFEGMYWDSDTSELVFPLPDGTEKRIAITDLITEYTGGTSANIQTRVTDEGVIISEIIPESVDGTVLTENINLRGNPTTTTQGVDDKSSKVATTEFVKKATIDNLTSYDKERPLSANMGRILNAEKTSVQDVMDIIAQTPLANVIDNLESEDPSAALSANMGRHLNMNKADKIHTSSSGATYGRSSANLFGHSRASSVEPLMDGEAEVGTDDGYFARGNHRHPTDTSRAPIHWEEESGLKMTGYFQAETPPADANDDRVATTKWVLDSGLVPSKTMIMEHKQDYNNPHRVSAEQLGLGSVLNDIAELQQAVIGSGVEPIPHDDIVDAVEDAWNHVVPNDDDPVDPTPTPDPDPEPEPEPDPEPTEATLTINYVGPEGDLGFATPESVMQNVIVGETYSVASPTVTNYTPDVATVTGTMVDGGVTVTVTYTHDTALLTITYTGAEELNPEDVIEEVNVGEPYSVYSPTVEGYVPDELIVNGIMVPEGVDVTVTYIRNAATLTINYVGPSGDPDWVEIPTYSHSYQIGESYTVESPEVTNYTADKVNVSGTMVAEGINETVTYTRNRDILTITYEGTGETIPNDVIEYNVGEEYNVNVPEVEGYTPNVQVVSGTMVDGGVNVTVTYTRNTATLTINYTGAGSNNPSTITRTIAIGDIYSVDSPTVTNYTPDIATVTGTMVDGGVTVTVTYTRNTGTLTINYVGAGSNTPSAVTQTLNVGDTYSVDSPEVEGYNVDIATVSGTMVDGGVNVTVTYTERSKGMLTINGVSDSSRFPGVDQYNGEYYVGDEYNVQVIVPEGKTVTTSIIGPFGDEMISSATYYYVPDRYYVTGTMVDGGVTETVTYTEVTSNGNSGYVDDNGNTIDFDPSKIHSEYSMGYEPSGGIPSKP